MYQTTNPRTYAEWIAELNDICSQELGLDFQDLPDVRSLDDFEAGISPEDAFQNYCADSWELYDPEHQHAALLDLIDFENFTDATQGL
jgi:hypothetical protein